MAGNKLNNGSQRAGDGENLGCPCCGARLSLFGGEGAHRLDRFDSYGLMRRLSTCLSVPIFGRYLVRTDSGLSR